MKIEIKRFKKFDNGKIKGVCDILIEDLGLTINGIKIIESQSNRHFYAFPSEKKANKETGEDKYWPICAIYDKPKYKLFHEELDNAFKRYTRSQKEDPMKIIPKVSAEPNYDDVPF